MQSKPPIVVDLDGTFLTRDIFLSEVLGLLTASPRDFIYVLKLLMFRKKALAKNFVAKLSRLDLDLFNKNEKLFRELELFHQSGHEIVLCSGASQVHVNQVVKKYPIFSQGFGTQGAINLAGEAKANFLVQKYGEKQFVYFGNSRADNKIYPHASSSSSVHAYWDNQPNDHRVLRKFITGLKGLRLKHWAKNLLVFSPLLMAHEFSQIDKLIPLVMYFLAFGLVASGSYLINDLIDVKNDSLHSSKKLRPIVTGAISIPQAIVAAIALIVLGLSITAILNWYLLLITGVYLLLTFSYMLVLKRIEIIDAVTLAGLYVQRIVAGFVSAQIAPTFWFLAFALFLFFALALLKRYTETSSTLKEGLVPGRGYFYKDAPILLQAGITSSFASIMILCLYLNSYEALELYTQPFILWLIVPVTLYWNVYLWLQATRGKINEDPIDWAVSNGNSVLCALLCVSLVVIAS